MRWPYQNLVGCVLSSCCLLLYSSCTAGYRLYTCTQIECCLNRIRAEASGAAANTEGVVFPHDPEGVRVVEGATLFTNEYELFLTELKDARGLSSSPRISTSNFKQTSPTTATFSLRCPTPSDVLPGIISTSRNWSPRIISTSRGSSYFKLPILKD